MPRSTGRSVSKEEWTPSFGLRRPAERGRAGHQALQDFYGRLMLKNVDFDEYDASNHFREVFLERPGDNNYVEICIWQLDGRYYLIPFDNFPIGKTLKFLEKDPQLEDFSYWNNTDQPEDVTDKEWGHREKIWDRLQCSGGPAWGIGSWWKFRQRQLLSNRSRDVHEARALREDDFR